MPRSSTFLSWLGTISSLTVKSLPCALFKQCKFHVAYLTNTWTMQSGDKFLSRSRLCTSSNKPKKLDSILLSTIHRFAKVITPNEVEKCRQR